MSNLNIAAMPSDWRASLSRALVEYHPHLTILQAMQTAVIRVEIRCNTMKKEFVVPVRKLTNYQVSPPPFTAPEGEGGFSLANSHQHRPSATSSRKYQCCNP